jgi:hypothetical protein
VAQAVIEIGGESTKLFVAEVDHGELRPQLERRLEIEAERAGPQAMAAQVRELAELARVAGAESIHLVMAPELGRGYLARSLGRRLGAAGLGEARLLTPIERGRLTFLGATARTGSGKVAVVELGLTALSISAGLRGERAHWWASRPLASRELCRRLLRGDPPSRLELVRAEEEARRHLGNLMPPPCEEVLLAGEDAALLALVCGPSISREACEGALARYGGWLSEMLASRFDIPLAAAGRVPGLLVIGQALGELFARPLRHATGGLAEGVLIASTAREIGAEGAAHA